MRNYFPAILCFIMLLGCKKDINYEKKFDNNNGEKWIKLDSFNDIANKKDFQYNKSILNEINSKKKKSSDIQNDINLAIKEFYIPVNLQGLVNSQNMCLQIGETVYKYSIFGLFSFEPNELETVNKIAANFDQEYINFIKNGEYYTLDGIKFYDLYGYINSNGNFKVLPINHIIEIEPLDNKNSNNLKTNNKNDDNLQVIINHKKRSTRNITFDSFVKNNTKTYNLETHNDGRTFVGGMIGKVFGGTFKSQKFDSEHKISCKFNNITAIAYNSGDFVVSFEKRKQIYKIVKIFGWRKKVTLATWWVKDFSPELIVGIEKFVGKITYEDFGLSTYNSKDATREGSSRIFNAISKLPFIKALEITNPKEIILNLNYNWNPIYISEYETDMNELFQLAKKGIPYIDNMFTSVVKNWNKKEDEYYCIDTSKPQQPNVRKFTLFGFTKFNNRSFIRFQLYKPTFGTTPPYSVEMQDYQIFGAAKYNGVWKGIRIMKR